MGIQLDELAIWMYYALRHIRDSTGEVLPLPARWLGSQENQPRTKKMDILEERKRHDKYMKLLEHLKRKNLPVAIKQCASCGGTVYGTDSNIQCSTCGEQSTNFGGRFYLGPAGESWIADCKASKKIAEEWMK